MHGESDISETGASLLGGVRAGSLSQALISLLSEKENAGFGDKEGI